MGDSAAFLSAGRLPSPHRPQHVGESRRPAATAGHDRALPLRHPVPRPRDLRRRAAPARQGRRSSRRRGRSRGQRGALSARSRRQRTRALLGPAAVGVAARRRWVAPHGDRAAESDAPARRGLDAIATGSLVDGRSPGADDRGCPGQAHRPARPAPSPAQGAARRRPRGLRAGSRPRDVGRSPAAARHQRSLVRVAARALRAHRPHRRSRRARERRDDGASPWRSSIRSSSC